MKKVTLLCGMLLAISASIASAAVGVNLRWNNCLGEGGASNRNSVCNTNAGSNSLTGSFEMGAALATVSGVEIVVDIATAGATLPAWWQFKNAGTCRSAALTMNGIANAANLICTDWASGASAGGLAAYNIGSQGPNTARIVAGFAVAADALADLFPGQEYFAFNALITNVKTVGTGSCAGCSVPACIIFNSINCATPPVIGQPSRDTKISGATNGTDSNFCTWQGGGGVTVGDRTGCPQAVPTHNTTWSQVKTLYR